MAGILFLARLHEHYEVRKEKITRYPRSLHTYTDIMRAAPNIIITGTPGVGKTTHCETLATSLGLKHLSINHIVKDRACHDGWDEEYQSWIVDEDKVGNLYFETEEEVVARAGLT